MPSLRAALRANGVFSTVVGLAIVAVADGLADYMAIAPVILVVVGIGTTVFGLYILWETRRSPIGQVFARLVITSDTVWVVGAIVVISIPGTMANKWLLAIVSSAVAVFAFLQYRGLHEVRNSA